MKVTSELVDHLAELSRIYLNENEKEKFKKDFENIVGYFDQLSAVDTNSVVVDKEHLNAATDLREDVAEECIAVEKVIMNAPKSKNGAIVVPMVVE